MCVKACEEKRDLAERKQNERAFSRKRVRIERIKNARDGPEKSSIKNDDSSSSSSSSSSSILYYIISTLKE